MKATQHLPQTVLPICRGPATEHSGGHRRPIEHAIPAGHKGAGKAILQASAGALLERPNGTPPPIRIMPIHGHAARGAEHARSCCG